MSASSVSPPPARVNTRQSALGQRRGGPAGCGAAAVAAGQACSKNRQRRRETVAARHRKIANQRKDFHHKQARKFAAAYDLLVVEDLRIANMLRRAKPVPDPDQPGHSCPMGPGRSPGSAGASVTLAGVSSSRFCAPKRKMLGASGLRSTPGTPPTAARPVGMQHRRIASRKRNFVAALADSLRRPTNTPRVTCYGLDWPFTRKPREKKPAASSRRRSHPPEGTSQQRCRGAPPGRGG